MAHQEALTFPVGYTTPRVSFTFSICQDSHGRSHWGHQARQRGVTNGYVMETEVAGTPVRTPKAESPLDLYRHDNPYGLR